MTGEIGAYFREDAVHRQLAWAAGLCFVDLRFLRISGGILQKISATLARSRRWVPMIFNPRRVVLIVDNAFVPFSFCPNELSELLGVSSDTRVEFVLASPSAIDAFLEERYADQTPTQ